MRGGGLSQEEELRIEPTETEASYGGLGILFGCLLMPPWGGIPGMSHKEQAPGEDPAARAMSPCWPGRVLPGGGFGGDGGLGFSSLTHEQF